MKTRRRILLVVGALLLAFAALVTVAEIVLGGAAGSLVVVTALLAAVAAYLTLIRPWQMRWGATDDEVRRQMPGDGMLGPGAGSTTRAVTIQAPADQVWPWLAQLGYGKAGWYSYDWLDNDGQPSAGQIQPQWLHLLPGDQILMMPGAGLDVVGVEDGHYFVARAPDGTTSWCLAGEPLDRRSCRLISRWHARWQITLASALWIALSDPGTFIMERKMLLGIKARAEQASEPGLAQYRLPGTPGVSTRGSPGVTRDVAGYRRSGVEVVGLVGIGGSPGPGPAVAAAALPVSADDASGLAVAYPARVALVWVCLNLLPAPDSCRVLQRAGGRVKDRAGARPV